MCNLFMPYKVELFVVCIMSCFGTATKKLQSCSLKLSAPHHLLASLHESFHPQSLIAPLLQGLQNLVGLIEESFTESGSLVQIGVDCIWQLLDLQLTPPRVQLCRMLASASLAHNLVRALGSVTRECASLNNHAAVSLHTCGPQQPALRACECRGVDQRKHMSAVEYGSPLRQPNHLLCDVHDWMHEVPTVPVQYSKTTSKETGLDVSQPSKRALTTLFPIQHQGISLPHHRVSLLP